MQNRTIADIHDKEIGHKKFAKFIDLALADNISITDIKEYYEKFKFKMNNIPAEFDKHTKDVKNQYYFIKQTIENQLILMDLQKGR